MPHNVEEPVDQEPQQPVDEVIEESLPVADVEEAEAASPPSEPPPATFRDQFAKYGVDVSEQPDDEAALRYVAQQLQSAENARRQAEQLGQLATYGQEYLQHAGEFQQYMAERQRREQVKPPDPYARPEIEPGWLQQVQRDEAGQLVPVNGGTPEIAAKVARFLDWREKFALDPYKHLESFVDDRASQRARELVAEEIARIRDEVEAKSFIGNNREWLFERGKFDASGNEVLSEEGRQFSRYLAEAAQAKLPAQQQQDLAMARLKDWRESQSLKAQIAEMQAKLTPEQQKEKFLTDAAGFAPNSDASANPPAGVPAKKQPRQNENATLLDELRQLFKDAGITDETLAARL